MGKSTVLRELLTSGETLVMPDAYDPVSARIIQQLGFRAVQCSGFSMALAACCPSEAEFGRERNVAATAGICQAVDVPVMADAEDGFGDATAMPDTVRAYLEAGVAGMNIEDEVLRPGAGPKALIPREEAAAKISAAREEAGAAGVPDLILNARTDALAVPPDSGGGMPEAITRGNLYLEAGADLVFPVGVANLDQVRTLVREIRGPVSIAAGMPYNLTGLSIAELRECGVARVSLPSLAIFAALKAIWQVFESVRDTDGFSAIAEQGLVWSMDEMRLLGEMQR